LVNGTNQGELYGQGKISACNWRSIIASSSKEKQDKRMETDCRAVAADES
jgi:hypothetical protein